MKSITACVEYDDFLAVTLKRNRRHFERTLVVTSPDDVQTQELVARLGCECHVTDAFYRDGATFNKGAAIEEGFDVLGRSGWICVWDADIVMPPSIAIPRKQADCLYSPIRHVLDNPAEYHEWLTPDKWERLPSPTPPGEFAGHFQLFHASAPLKRPWYGTAWNHAGGCDSDFQAQFPIDKCRRPPFTVLHLGPEGVPELGTRIGRNWLGRVSTRIDTGSAPPPAPERHGMLRQMVEDRKSHGLSRERIAVVSRPEPSQTRPPIPRVMSCFWDGRMSWLRWLSLATFRQHNPDWTICLYEPVSQCAGKRWSTPEDADRAYTGPDYRDRIDELGVERCWWQPPIDGLAPAQACDILEWWVLSHRGGFFADMDVLWLRSIETLWQSVASADAVFCLESGMLAIGFFAARDECPLFWDLYHTAVSDAERTGTGYQHFGTHLLYRLAKLPAKEADSKIPGVFALKRFREIYHQLKIVTVPDETVYPFDWREIGSIFKRDLPVPDESIGLHWFGGSEIAQKWNCRLTEENWRQYRNTLTRCLRSVLK